VTPASHLTPLALTNVSSVNQTNTLMEIAVYLVALPAKNARLHQASAQLVKKVPLSKHQRMPAAATRVPSSTSTSVPNAITAVRSVQVLRAATSVKRLSTPTMVSEIAYRPSVVKTNL
jgi:hypothetical protein